MSVINEPEFIFTKNSLLEIEEKNRQFATDIIDYVNDTSLDADDEFFYNMLEFVRFTKDSQIDVAATDPQGLIYMKPPQGFDIKEWDFIYSHECMHQIWDTFGVADKIKAAGLPYNHTVLNLASDCVINDYLYKNRRKKRPNGLITPEYIKDNFGVEYDRKTDTQYTLYEKIMGSGKQPKDQGDPRKITPKRVQQGGGSGPIGPIAQPSPDYVQGWKDGIKDVLDKKVDPLKYNPKPVQNDYDQGYNDVLEKIKKGMEEGIEVGGDPGGGPTGPGGLPQIPWDLPKEDKDDMDRRSGGEAADQAEQDAQDAQKSADQAKSSGDKDAAKEAQEAADKAKEEAKKAREAAENGEEQKAKDHAKEAKKEAKKAANAAKNGSQGSQGSQGGNGQGHGQEWGEVRELEMREMSNIKRKHDEYVKRAVDKISGDWGQFINKCDDSKNLKGLVTKAQKGPRGWEKKAFKSIDSYIYDTWGNPEYEPTYKKWNRRAGMPKMGQPIKKGKRKIEDKFNLNISLFVDCSGSMGRPNSNPPSRIDNACEAMYDIAKGLKRNWTNTECIDKVDFDFFSWGDYITPLSMGKVPDTNQGTMDMDDLIRKIYASGNMYGNVNFIITDGETTIDKGAMDKLLDSDDSMWIIASISQSDKSTHEALMKSHKNYCWIPCSDQFD